jgi:hypothetical protein
MFRNLKKAIRIPSSAYSAVTESHTAAFLVKEAEALANTTHMHVPPVVIAVAEMLFKRTPFGRVIDVLKRAAAKREQQQQHQHQNQHHEHPHQPQQQHREAAARHESDGSDGSREINK